MVERSARHDFQDRTGDYEHARFGNVVTAMVTPFDRSKYQHIDIAATGQLARFLVANGSKSLVLAGTTGESPTLKQEEERRLFSIVRTAVDVPILAGTGSNDTKTAVELTQKVSRNGNADGILAVSPYYNRPSQAGIFDYYRQVAGATRLPVIVYDIPVRTGRGVEPETLVKLASNFENIVGFKDATNRSPAETVDMMRAMPAGFEWYSGDDDKNLERARAGCVGAISVASHWAGRAISDMFDYAREGKWEEAEAIDKILKPSYAFETGPINPNPIPTKYMLSNILGIDVGEGRSPMVVTDPEALISEALEVYVGLIDEGYAVLKASI